MNQLLKNAKGGSNLRWGTALLRTQQWALQQSGASSFYGDLGRTEQIFGDPAMPVFSLPGQVEHPGPQPKPLRLGEVRPP